ncbi:MAG: hypothetical protein JSU01_16855 [Bacteroidetes bacterium]|nr:hypothetical protein [Bacteroidota bacterium]
MSKLRLPLFIILSASLSFIIQSCNKDSVVSTAYTTAAFQANIDGNVWAPDTTSIAVNYSQAAGIKTLVVQGTRQAKQVIFNVTLPNTNTAGFPLGTYTIDGSSVTAQYNTQSVANGPFAPRGTVEPGAGSIIITAVDSVKKQITGTFSFYSRTTNYDNNGNVISIVVDNITGGEFTAVPYTYTSN